MEERVTVRKACGILNIVHIFRPFCYTFYNTKVFIRTTNSAKPCLITSYKKCKIHNFVYFNFCQLTCFLKYKWLCCKTKLSLLVMVNKVNPFPHNDTLRCPWETSLLKTLWEKEKLLVTSNFSFSHGVFYLFG